MASLSRIGGGTAARQLGTTWRCVELDGAPYYLNDNLKLACTALPGKRKLKRATKVSIESGTYVVTPRPKGLTEEWEQAVCLNPDGFAGGFVYHNTETGATSKEDPRPGLLLGDDPLPAGWSLNFDEDGDMFFIDHNSGITTYDDPRVVCSTGEASEAERIAEKETNRRQPGLDDPAVPHRPVVVPTEATPTAPTSEPAPASTWKIAAINHSGFNSLAQHLTPKDRLPDEVIGKSLNRYTNILPNPRTRVRLEDEYEPWTSVSTYINANYIAGYSSQPREYIAAMGPLDNTIEAFWRMVWMVKSPAIVMTTPMMEQGRVKCARYWPTVRYNEAKKVGDRIYGHISVAVCSGEQHPGYILTHIRLRKGKEEQLLRHYWFQNWPDHGVPSAEGAHQVIAMMQNVRAFCEEQRQGPPIVHCSAGIGRTGTFIAIDQAVRCLEETGEVDCLQIVANMRKHRGGMVQHPQQYEFIVKACVHYARSQSRPYDIVELERTSQELPPVPPHRPSLSGGQVALNWKATLKSKKPQHMAELIAHGRPENMPEEEWQRLNRKYRKQQASVRAANSMRRHIDEAEMHGELRLGTLSGGTNDGKYRPTMKAIFEDK